MLLRNRKGGNNDNDDDDEYEHQMVTPMQIQSSAATAGRTPSRALRKLPVYLTAAAGALILLLFVLISFNDVPSNPSPMMEDSSSTSLQTKRAGKTPETIVSDSVGGVNYYHCYAKVKDEDTIDLVLLHGAAFTKENWKESKILDKLCHVPKLSVTAMDLPSRANHKELKNVLSGLRQTDVINPNKPIALVTPSASGFTIVDWLGSDNNNNADELATYVKYWIPVASPSIKRASETDLEKLKGRVDILAVYGSRDKGGKTVSKRLESLADARVVEIDGGHPCYLDSPDDFIKELLSFLDQVKSKDM